MLEDTTMLRIYLPMFGELIQGKNKCKLGANLVKEMYLHRSSYIKYILVQRRIFSYTE